MIHKSDFGRFILESIKDSNYESYTRILKVLNKLNIAVEVIILQLGMVYKYFDIPQRRKELNTHLVEHPITAVAKEIVLKNLRDMRSSKANAIEE